MYLNKKKFIEIFTLLINHNDTVMIISKVILKSNKKKKG